MDLVGKHSFELGLSIPHASFWNVLMNIIESDHKNGTDVYPLVKSM